MKTKRFSFQFTIAFLVYSCFLLNSCDCWTSGNGVVIDKITNKPLDSVIAKSYIDNVKDDSYVCEMYSDTNGKFYGSTGNTGSCQDLVIVLSKTGYKSATITNPQKDTIRLEKE